MRITTCALEQHIVVASKNPAKIDAAKAAVKRCFPNRPCRVYGERRMDQQCALLGVH